MDHTLLSQTAQQHLMLDDFFQSARSYSALLYQFCVKKKIDEKEQQKEQNRVLSIVNLFEMYRVSMNVRTSINFQYGSMINENRYPFASSLTKAILL